MLEQLIVMFLMSAPFKCQTYRNEAGLDGAGSEIRMFRHSFQELDIRARPNDLVFSQGSP
jgi:hypothetical protein